MPELPEVETVARDLDAVLRGQVFSSVELVEASKVLQTPLPRLRKAIIGHAITRVYRRAKMLIIEQGNSVIVFHLKMTGQLIFVSKKITIAGGHPIRSTGITVPNKYTRLIFTMKSGGNLYFNDLRKFGWVRLMTKDDFIDLEKGMGIEPLEATFTLLFFRSIMARRGRAPIKAVLLDQKYLVGLGNIYVDEVLFRAKVRPNRRTESLTGDELKRIWRSIPLILKKSITERGTTFKNFVDSDGLKGNFMAHLKVYGRGNKPCSVCGRPLQKTRVAGRGTHWCAHCQH